MSSVYLNPQQSSSLTFLEQLKGDHQQQQHSFPMIGYLHDHVTSSNNHHHAYFSCSSFENHRNSAEFLALEYSRRTQDKVVEKLFQSHDKITNLSQNTTLLDGSGCSYIHPFDKGDDPKIEPIKTNIQKPKKCKPTKLRIMQKETVVVEKPKKMKVDHHKVQPHDHVVQPQKNMKHHNTSYENNGSHGFLRMCSDCHTTTTPLWRSGPQGPKSLCNACGIRQRKARRAAMAAAAAAAAAESTVTSPMSSTITSTTTTTIPSPKLAIDEEIKSKLNLDHEKNNTLPLKKRSKTLHFSSFDNNNNNNNEDSSINNIANINNNNNSYFQREFPSDEEEGAILLMALSCGLACSS